MSLLSGWKQVTFLPFQRKIFKIVVLMEMEKVDPRSQADTVDSDVVEMVILF